MVTTTSGTFSENYVIHARTHRKVTNASLEELESFDQSNTGSEAVRIFALLTQAIAKTSDPLVIEQQIMRAVFALSPAHRACWIPHRVVPEPCSGVKGWNSDLHPCALRVNRFLIARVLEQNAPLVCDTKDRAFERQQDADPLWTAAFPLQLYGRARGLLYLEAPQTFDTAQLEWLKSLAAIAALALEDVPHLEAQTSEKRPSPARTPCEHDMVGDSRKMQDVYSFIRRVAPAHSSVLICGESGTGKELVAHALHRNSGRASRPFVALNCAALTETLLESELFGHEKGSFTGAFAQKKGKLETAEGGTVFLDEVGEMPLVLQAKLLRVLQEREFERVGGTRPIKLDIRILAATNRDLWEEVRCGRFRADLLYRLNVVSISMPALRDRREDVLLLARHFAARHRARLNLPSIEISRGARTRLLAYDWPGNVRELENAMERAVVMGTGNAIEPEDLQFGSPESTAKPDRIPTIHEAIRDLKKHLILRALDASSGDHTEAAKLLGVHVNHLSRLITDLAMRAEKKLLLKPRAVSA